MDLTFIDQNSVSTLVAGAPTPRIVISSADMAWITMRKMVIGFHEERLQLRAALQCGHKIYVFCPALYFS